METPWQDGGTLLVHVMMGAALAACAGLRAFLPLLVVGVAGRLAMVPLSESFTWLESWPAIIVFGVAVMAEALGDKFPIVDHFLDSIQTFVKPIAGALVMATVVEDWAPLYATVFLVVVGGSTAGAVHVTKAKLRLVSSVTTGGLGNPLLSATEDVGALAGTVGAVVVPPLAVLGLATAALVAWLVLRRWRRRAESGRIAA
jgi:multisubunit Na+/H+ antiporter MnhC subunit